MLKYTDFKDLSLKNFKNLGDIIIDGGAAKGIFSQILSKNNPMAQIYCYEPLIENFRILEKIKANNMVFKNFALSSDIGDKKFALSYRSPIDGTSHVGRIVNNNFASEHIKIKTVNLDYEIKDKISLLKLDIQGHEYDALIGAENLLKKSLIDRLWIEFVGDFRILNFLTKFDYMFCATEFQIIELTKIDLKDIPLELIDIKKTSTNKNIYKFKAPLFYNVDEFSQYFKTIYNLINVSKIGFFFTDLYFEKI